MLFSKLYKRQLTGEVGQGGGPEVAEIQTLKNHGGTAILDVRRDRRKRGGRKRSGTQGKKHWEKRDDIRGEETTAAKKTRKNGRKPGSHTKSAHGKLPD